MEEQESLQPLSESQKEALEEATARYQSAVSVDVITYLDDRGISAPAMGMFRLGEVADPLPGHERYRGSVAIPYLDRKGGPLTIRFRCIKKHDHREFHHGKYASVPGDPPRMFNVGAIFRAKDEIHVTEGEFDAIVLNGIGLPAVAIPGSHLWQPRHRIMLSGFNRIWVWGDPDDAGADMVNKITRALPRARGVRLKDGDVSEMFLAGGAEALLSLLPERSV